MGFVTRRTISTAIEWLSQKANGNKMDDMTHAEKDVVISDLRAKVDELSKDTQTVDPEFGYAGEHVHNFTNGMAPGNKAIRACIVPGCGKTEGLSE